MSIPDRSQCKTRLHSSMMRTARLLPVSPSMHYSGGGVCSLGVSGPGGVWSQGGCLVQGGVVSQHALRQTPPVKRMTDRCKNITLPQTSFAGGKNLFMPQLMQLLNCKPTKMYFKTDYKSLK